MTAWNPEKVRQDFVLLQNTDRVYFDNAATSQKPKCVIDAVQEFYEKYNANVLRGLYPLSVEATERYENARKTVQRFIHAACPEEIIFTRNATESMNLVAYSYGMANLKAGDEILVSILEHHSNILPWQMVSRATGAKLVFLECEPDGTIPKEKMDEAFSEHTKLVAVTQVSNVLGCVNDIPELVNYGKSKNVGIILWAGYHAFDRDMEKVVKHYSNMGVKGFKVDFMDRDDQEIVNFLYRGAETCAKYKMMVDYHGICKPTGLQRTYPNVINYEGVHGLENMKWAASTYDMPLYDVTIPFVRMVAGPMDYTQGAMRNAIRKNYAPIYTEPMSQGTRCHQLATYVIFESPLNMLCDNPSNYNREPECTEFIANIPTVWEKTVALDGKVGEFVAIARLHGNDWYVGALTNWDAREVELDLSFLGDGNYKLELFKDGINADRAACDYKKEVIPVPADRKVKVKMAPGGGWAAKIYK